MIRQVDIKNGISEIFNWFPVSNPDPTVAETIWVPERQVAGEDKGIQHSFNVTLDQFAQTDRRLVNHKNYYFTVLAYGYNNYQQYLPLENIGQRKPYIEGRRKGEDIFLFTKTSSLPRVANSLWTRSTSH